MDLSPEQRQQIYEEERARIERERTPEYVHGAVDVSDGQRDGRRRQARRGPALFAAYAVAVLVAGIAWWAGHHDPMYGVASLTMLGSILAFPLGFLFWCAGTSHKDPRGVNDGKLLMVRSCGFFVLSVALATFFPFPKSEPARSPVTHPTVAKASAPPSPRAVPKETKQVAAIRQAATSHEEKSEDPLLWVTSEGYLGAVSEEALGKGTDMQIEGDMEALARLQASGLVFPVRGGMKVYVTGSSGLLASAVKLRVKGTNSEFWTVQEAIHQ